MGIEKFLGFRRISKRGGSRGNRPKGLPRHRRMLIEQCEHRLLLSGAPVLTSLSPMTGPATGGTQVTIIGTNLTGAMLVKFGSMAATIDSDTATQIVATSPAEAAGTVDVTVKTTAGTSALSAVDQFTYVAVPTGPQLVAIVPNTGSVLTAGEVLNVAPTQLTLQFNQYEQIDPTTLSGITVSYTNAAGTTANAPIGYLAVNDAPNLNQVVVRFSQTLLSGSYTIAIAGAGANALQGELVDPTTGTAGSDLPFNSGQDYALSFTLDLGSMVNGVVPQPVTRTSTGQLQQAVNEIDVYFTDQLSTASAENPQFYQLIATDNTANTNNQTIQTPASVVYNSATHEASLYFFQNGPYYADPNKLSATDRAHDLSSLAPNGTQAMRLRIGDAYQQISTLSISPAAGAAGTTYADAYAVPSFTAAAQSYVISNEIETTAYDLQWPGSAIDPGNRKMVNDPSVPDLVIEDGFGDGVGGAVGDIPTFTYNFPATYGTLANGTVARNQITPVQEQDTREIFTLLASYLGVQFQQLTTTAFLDPTDNPFNIGVVTGDLSAVGFTSGTGVPVVGGDGLAVVDASKNWGASPYGGDWMQTAMEGVMLCLDFGRSYNLPQFQVMGDDLTQANSDVTLPGVGNLTTGLNLYPAISGDINMYKLTLTTPGTLSTETIAQRLPGPSLLDTELRVFQQNADGSYSAIAQNDNYFGTDSYVSLSLQPGTYFVGVTAAGDDLYDPSIPNSGMNGRTTGPYELRVDFTPQETLGPAEATASGNIVLTGANITVNTGTTPFAAASAGNQVTIEKIDPIDVPDVAALNGETFTVAQGTATYSFQFVDTSIADNQAAAGKIAIDFDSTTDTIDAVRADMVTAINDVFTVLVNATGTPFDGDADGTPGGLYNYWFNVAGIETSGAADRTIFVDKSAASGGTGGIAAPYSTISAALAAAATDARLGLHDIVRIEGNHTATLSDDQSYNIGTDIFGNALSDGATMVVPRDTTVMIDAGTVFKLRGTNIQVGSSSVNINLSGASLQVLGTPLDPVYFTSWQDSSVGETSNPLTTPPKAGDWGGIVFENDLDIAYDTTTPPPAVLRPDPEANGIFLDYVNGAELLYGGGVVSNNSVRTTYDPIYMVEARPTLSYNVIEHSADAAMSADPNSFQESLFEGDNSATGLYTNDYDRVGPALNANLLLDNSINGMLVRIRTAAGEPIDRLTTTAQFDSPDITYVIPENLEIAGNPGGPVVAPGSTSPLPAAGPQQIQAVPGFSLVDGNTFTITKSGSTTGVVFEFDGVSLSVLSGSSFSNGDLLTIDDPANPGSNQTFEFETTGQAVTNPSYTEITYDPSDTPDVIEAAIAAAINSVGDIELTGTKITVNKGTTPFARAVGSGGATIQKIDAAHVPNVQTLNGETFTVTQGTTSFTFQFVDTSSAANQVAAGNTAIDYDSASDTIDTVRAAMLAAINAAFNGSLTATDLEAIPLPYDGGEVATMVPAMVALESFTTTQTITFTHAGGNPGVTVYGAPGVAAGHQRIVFDASQSADQVALDIQAAIVASGLYPASAVTVQGTVVTINDPTASLGGLLESTESPGGSLVVDPGVVVKLDGSRIEAEMGATFIAEGTANDPVVFTSVQDDRYGSGGTFDLTGDGYTPFDPTGATAPSANTPQPGDWGGVLADPVSEVSIDHAVFAFAGGLSSIEGGFAAFNAVETYQAQLRITNSLLEDNADGAATGTDPDRAGRGANGAATIYVLGAQPVIVDNTFLNNDLDRGGTTSNSSPVISIDVDSLNSDLINDWGRATGPQDAFTQYNGNFGPLVRGNILENNGLNGMLVRSGVLSTQSVWDDTDIVYIVEGEISVPNLHTYGGLRLQSSSDASLVVKLFGADAGFTATGESLDITDRIGGAVQIVGQPGYPVILTSLNDNTVGAGFDLSGNPQDDTVNNPKAVPAPGDWRSVLIEQYSNDTNVEVVEGLDAATGATADTHSTPATAQYLGELAASPNAGDDTLRLGFEVHGAINYDNPSSVDVYSFTGTAGTDVYIAMDLTSFSLDSVLELIDANGNVIAQSDNKEQEDPALGGNTIYLGGSALPFQEGDASAPIDSYSDNADDPALRVVLPGPTGHTETYYVRVYSALNIGHIDAADVPNLAALNGTTFQVADSNTLAIGDIDTSHVLPGIGIGAAGVPSLAALNLETFALTVGSGTVTFQLVDTSNPANQAAAGNTAIDFNSTTDSLATVCGDIAGTITAAGLGLTATALVDDSIAISGAAFAFAPGTSPFRQQILTGLNGTTFQVTDATGKSVTFQFVDSSSASVATAGDQAIAYNSTMDTIDSIRNEMVAAINSAGLACTALAQSDGTIALTGLNVTVDLGQTPFLAVGSTNRGATFEFIDTNGATQPTAGDQAIYYNSTTDTIDDIRNDMVLAINGYTAMTGVDATHVPNLAALDGETFEIADNANNLVTFEFIDSMGSIAPAKGDAVIAYDSATDTISDIRADVAAAVNASGLEVAATAETWGVALAGTNIAFGAGTTPFGSAVVAGADCGVTAQARPDGTIGLYGYQITFSAGSTPFVEYGRSSGSYQMQIRLQADMDIPGSEVQYADISYATDGVDIQGMPSSSPVLTSLNSLDATTFANAQNIGNVLDTSNSSISVSGYLSSATDVNWYSFQLSYQDIMNLSAVTSFPLIFNVSDADGLTRPDTMIWVFDSSGDLIYEATSGSSAVDHQYYLNGTVNPNGTSYGPDDPFLGPIELTESASATYYVAVTGTGMTADALTQSLTRQAPISPITRVVTSSTQIGLTPEADTLADITLYTNTGTNLITVNPMTGVNELDVTGGAGDDLPQAPGVTYGDIAMRPDGELFGFTDSTTSETLAGQYVQIDTGNATNAIAPTPTWDGIQSYTLDASGTTVDEQTGDGFNVNAMAYGPLATTNWPLFVVGSFAQPYTNITGVAPAAAPVLQKNLLFKLNPDGTAIPYPGQSTANPQLGSNIIPLAQLNSKTGGGGGGNITGMAFLDGQMYCVDDTGDLFTLNGLDYSLSNNGGDYGFQPETSNGVNYIAPVTGAGPTLKFIGTLKEASGKAIAFEGLTDGPPDVIGSVGQSGPYGNLLFAVDSSGNLYAINPTTGKLQAVLVDGRSSVPTGIAGAQGLAFSNVDYNLWHTASGPLADPAGGGSSYYFGIDNSSPGSGNYQWQNPGVIGTYNAPGGAEGSLESTQTFSLAGYTTTDLPTLTFDYYVDTSSPSDAGRVWISNDGTNWTLLDTLSGANGGAGWKQAVVNLGAFVGDTTLQLRFDFSTAPNPSQEQSLIGGGYLAAVPGNQLRDGDQNDYLQVAGVDGDPGGNFEFDLGAVLDVPAGPGADIANGQTFALNDGTKSATFELDNGSDPTLNLGTNIPVYIRSDDSPSQIVSEIGAAIEAAGLNVTVYTDTASERVEIVSKATPSTLSITIGTATSGNAITLEGDGPGNGGNATVGTTPIAADTNTIIPVNFSMTAAQVAQEMVTVMDATMNVPAAAGDGDSVILDSTQTNVVQMIGHTVTENGTMVVQTTTPTTATIALPYAAPSSQPQNIVAGQQNTGGGFAIDNLVIGFDSRGVMLSGTAPDTTFNFGGVPAHTITSGSYVLEIQRAPVSNLTQKFNINDRFTTAYTLQALPGTTITSGDTFYIYDGFTTEAFEFVLQGLTAAAGDIPIYFTGLETAPEIASLVNAAINAANAAGFDVYSTTTSPGDRVNLFNAQIVAAPDGGINVLYFQPAEAFTYAIPGDVNATQAVGETIIDANQISNSQDWGILVEPGTRDPGSKAPHPGSVNPLTVDNDPLATPNNPLGQVGGVTLENNVIDTFGDGGIELLGDPDPAGEPTAAVPFFRVVNNTLYGGAATAPVTTTISSFTKLTGTTGTSNGTAVYQATLTGLTSSLVRTLTITDNSGGLSGGGTGQYSGLELDGIMLSATNAASAAAAAALTGMNDFNFSPSGTSLTPGTEAAPTGGPLFGTLNGQLDNTVATLQSFDASGNASTTPADFVALGIGGSITFTFTSPVNLNAGPVYLYIAEADDDGGVPAATVTVTGGGAPPAGIAVGQHSAPTLLNNIISSVQDAVTVDATSTSTVLGDTVYQNITDPAINAGIGITGINGIGLGTFPLSLGPGDPLFVDAAAGNFYLAAGSPAIGSGLNSLPDRPGMVTVETSLGLPQSPVVTPSLDELGQTREDATPPGQGSSIFVDRGAIARVDITPPTAQLGLVEPPAGSSGGVAPQWVANDSTVPAGQTLSAFAIQLTDTGTGISNATVSDADITVYRSDNPTTPLVEGMDYFYSYDAVNHVIYLAAAAGTWVGGYTYTIDVDNSAASGIQDLAGNLLAPNQPDGTTSFAVTVIGDENYSHAPGYPIAWHSITDNLYLGNFAPLPQPYFIPSLTSPENGVDFSNITLIAGQTAVLPITVTNTTGRQAYLNAWIDFNDSGTFTADDQIIDALKVSPGVNNVTITVPASAVAGTTWARFRISTTAALGPSGGAPDGEVEDYDNVTIEPPPISVTGTVYNDYSDNGQLEPGDSGLAGWTVYLDTSGNGMLEPGDPSAVTGANGQYTLPISFTGITPGTYALREQPPSGTAGFVLTQPAGGSYSILVASGLNYTGKNFGNYDTAPPTVASILPEVPPDSNPTEAGTVHFVATFSQPVTGVSASDFYFVASSGITAATVSSVTPGSSTASTTFVVTVSGITGDGTLAIELADLSSAIQNQSSTELTGPGSSAANPFISQPFTIDHTPPTINPNGSISLVDPSLTNLATVQYLVTFSKPVLDVQPGDFVLVPSAGITAATIYSISPNNPATASQTYTVTVTGVTGTGTLGLNLAVQGTPIEDAAGNVLTGEGASAANPFVGHKYTIDQVQPMVDVALAAGQPSPATTSPVNIAITFSEPVLNFTKAGIDLSASTNGIAGNATMTLTGSGAVYDLSIGGLIGSGSLVVKVLAGAAQDAAGNGNAASSPVSLLFTAKPDVSISRAATQADPINRGPIYFTVEFDQAVTDFSASSLSFAGSTAPGTLAASITAGPTPVVRNGATDFDYTVAVTGMTGTGLVLLSIPAGSVHNSAGTGNTASTGTTNDVFFDNVPPVITLISPATGSSVSDTELNARGYIDVSYSASGVGVNISTITNVFSLDRNNQPLPGVVVNSATDLGGDTFRYTFTGDINPGVVDVVFVVHTFQDDAGNWNAAATYAFTVLPSPPSATAQGFAATAGATLTVAAPGVLANATDPQGYALTANLVTKPAHGTLSLNGNGSFTYIPNPGYIGTDSFVYRAGDGSVTSSPITDWIYVAPSTMAWTGTSGGDWTSAQWSNVDGPYPDSNTNAVVQMPYVVEVTSAQAAYSLEISDGAEVAVAAGASLTVTSGTSVTSNGTLSVDPQGAFSTGGTLVLDSGGSLVGGPITAAAYQLNAGTASADLAGPGGLTKDTSGTLVLSGTNTYAGGTVVNSGTLVAASAGALPHGTSLSIGAGGIFVFDPSQSATGGLVAAAADIAADGAASKSIVAAASLAQVPAATPAVSTVVAAMPAAVVTAPAGTANSAATAAGDAGQRVFAAARPAAMSSVPVDAVFTRARSAFDPTASPANAPQVAYPWAWLAASEISANSSDQQQKMQAAVDKVLAEMDYRC